MHSAPVSPTDLYAFILKATQSTYAAGKPPEKTSQRPDFIEYAFTEGDWFYLDSYTGFFRSAGTEVVRYQGQVVWINAYSGGMVAGKEAMAQPTFDFLKIALSQDRGELQTIRGPLEYAEADWKYHYHQTGDITSYFGQEEIQYQGKLIFFHHTHGGIIIPK